MRSNPAPGRKVPGPRAIRGRRDCRPGAAVGPLGASSGHSTGAEAARRSAVDVLMDDYLAGQTVYEQAAEFGIERRTVSAHPHQRGVPMRRRGLSLAQKKEAFALRDRGWSLARIGARFDVSVGTVRNVLCGPSN